MKKFLVTTSLSLLASSLLPAQLSQLKFINGDELKGSIVKVTPSEIHFKHPAFKGTDKTQVLKTDQIHSIHYLDRKREDLKPGPICQLTMCPRYKETLTPDVYQGSIVTVNKDFVIISTPFAGEIKVKKKFISKLDVINSSEFMLNGLGKLSDWTVTPANAFIKQQGKDFAFNKSTDRSTRTAYRGITKKVEYPDRFHCNVTVSRDGVRNTFYSNFSIGFFTNKAATTGISVNLQYSEVQVRKGTANTLLRRRIPMDIARSQKKVIFDIFADKKNKTLSIYMNDQLIQEDIDISTLDFDKLDPYINFRVPGSNSGLLLQNFTLRKWNGSKRAAKAEDRIKLEVEGEAIHLQNGDIMRGHISKIEGNIAFVKTRFGIFKVRLSNISSLDIGSNAEENIKMNASDARLTFLNGSQLIVKVEDITTDKILGSSQSFEGIREFNTKNLKSIEFENAIYD